MNNNNINSNKKTGLSSTLKNSSENKNINKEGDGNCLFRSVSDQMDNNQNNYKLYREMCINYMKENKDEFIPFIEDDEPYDKYISRMEEDGEWGGNLEIYALSKVLNANFYIYIHKHPMYIVNNFEKPKKNILLTYHEGKHYNSLRKLEEKNKEDKEKEEKKKKEKLEEENNKEENEDEEEEEEDDDDNNDINNLINQVEHLNI